ncbi:MAG: 2-oxoacid:acceptor oxidoreductase family protein [Acidobacteriota bacterium]
MQQIILSGVGGQGVLFVTKLLAETALDLGCSVLISETHGMAQRGGNVISHLKISDGGSQNFISPLIRPGKADVLLALHPDGFAAHGFFLKKGGNAFRNMPAPEGANALDATQVASDLGAPISANLVLLGFSAARGGLFCGPEAIEATLKRFGGKRLEISLKALRAGWEAGKRA